MDDSSSQPPSRPPQVPPPASPIYAPGLVEREIQLPPPPPPVDLPSPAGVGGNPIATFLAWMIILGITALLFLLNLFGQYIGGTEQTTASAAEKMQANFQAKILLGLPTLLESLPGNQAAPGELPTEEAAGLNGGPPELRCGYTVLVNELEGPDAALDAVAALSGLMNRTEGFVPTPEQEKLVKLLSELYTGYARGQWDAHQLLGTGEREFIASQLGWTGRIAMHPELGPDGRTRKALLAEARMTLVRAIAIACGLALALFLGLAIAFVLLVTLAGGGLRSRWYSAGNRGGIYAETFAFWMVLFLCGSLLGAYLDQSLSLSPVSSVALSLMVFFGSLVALGYPVVRGIPFEVVRSDIGWKIGNPASESFFGAIGYLGWMPAVGFGLIASAVTAVVVTFTMPGSDNPFVSSSGGSHPIQDELATGNVWVIVGVFLTACVAAPIVEETVFRGVLYRHLREMRDLPRVFNVIVAAVISSFIFASIHPQGIIGIPVLTMLAIGFALVREWRGSLIGPMAMHAVHNGIVTCILLLMI